MGVAYAPFDDPPPAAAPSFRPVVAPTPFERDATECNYLVMFFVAGVFLLGMADTMR